MRKFFLFILFLTISHTVIAQLSVEAEMLFNAGEYAAAKSVYGQLLDQSSQQVLYNYRYARCAYELGEWKCAEQYFLRAGYKYPLTHYYLGEIYTHYWRFAEAEQQYQLYCSKSKPNERIEHIQEQLRVAKRISRYLHRVEKVSVLDSIDIALPSLLFSCHTNSEVGTWTIDSLGLVSYTNQRGDIRICTVPINDGRGSILVRQERLLDDWSMVDTLPSQVNFTTCINYPFLSTDGITLYYAACDSIGIGGWDIYVSRYHSAGNLWTQSENIGLPYNSEADECLYAVDEANGVVYMSTTRFSAKDSARIYLFEQREPRQYWRDEPDSVLLPYARLERYCLSELQQPIPPMVAVEDTLIQKKQPVKTEPQPITPRQELDQLREAYRLGNEVEKERLTPLILELENSLE